MDHDQKHHTKSNCLNLIFFSTGDSHTKEFLVLFYLGLEDRTDVDTHPKNFFLSFNYTVISIDRLPSETKIGKYSWCFNKSFLFKTDSSQQQRLFFIQKHKKQPLFIH